MVILRCTTWKGKAIRQVDQFISAEVGQFI